MTQLTRIAWRSLFIAVIILFLTSWIQFVSASSKQADQQLYTQYSKLAKHTKTRMMVTPGNHPTYDPNQIIYYESQLPQKLTPIKATKSYKNALTHFPIVQYSPKYDHSTVVHGHGTKQQRAELRKYALQLINSYRVQHGASVLRPTADEDRAVDQTADLREHAHMLYEHIRFQKSYLQIYNNIGMEMTGENLSINPWAGKAIKNNQPVTMMMLKTGIYTSLETMVYADGANQWGHRENFLRADKMDFSLQYCGPRYDVPYVYVFEAYTPTHQYLMYADQHLQMAMTKPQVSTKPINAPQFTVKQTLHQPSARQRAILRKLQSYSKN